MKKVPWKVDRKLESLEAWIHELNEEARVQFMKAGTHVELLLVFSDAGPTTMLPVYRISHDEAEGRLKALVLKEHAYAVAHIVACKVDVPLDPDDDIHLRVAEGDVSEKNVVEDEEEHLAEILVVHAHSREPSNITFFSPVVRGQEEVLLMNTIRLNVRFEGGSDVD